MRIVPLALLLLSVGCKSTPDLGRPGHTHAMPEDAAFPDAAAADSSTPTDAGTHDDSARDAASRRLFNGVDLTGFSYDPAVWRVEGDEIVGSAPAGSLRSNTFLIHQTDVADFVLSGELWLGAGGNSGIQYRSRPLVSAAYGVAGYQLDAADGYWGALYEEGGRGLMLGSSCLDVPRGSTWVRFTVTARGNELVHTLNGTECVRLVDDAPERESHGLLALQYHVPGGYEVRFRGLVVTELGL